MRRNHYAVLTTIALLTLHTALFAATYIVDNLGSADNLAVYTATDGTNTLRKCIRLSNGSPGADTILFSVSGTLTHTIDPGAIVQQLFIDGSSAPGYSPGNPTVMLDAGGGGYPGLNIQTGADGSRIKGLSIVNTGQSGILVNACDSITIEECFIGVEMDGNTATGNATWGVQFLQSDNDSIKNCVISGNAFDGVRFENATNGVVIGSTIGLNAGGTVDLGNGECGIRYLNNSNNHRIEDCVLSGNQQYGAFTQGCQGFVMQGNLVGLNAAGDAAIGNEYAGINFDANSSDLTFGGTAVSDRNIVSGNGYGVGDPTNMPDPGLRVGQSSNVTVYNNYFGTDMTGLNAIPNLGDGIFCGLNASNIVIGGASYTQRNVLSGNTRNGIYAENTNGLEIAGNFVGVAADGVTPLSNYHGINLTSNVDNYIIGGINGKRNIVAGNQFHGIHVNGCDNGINSIVGNYVGFDSTGVNPIPNVQSGIIFIWSNNCTVGGTSEGEGNYLGANGEFGIHYVGGMNHNAYNNKIGVNVNGGDAGNGLGGIFIQGIVAEGRNIRIGGAGDLANIIAYNKNGDAEAAILGLYGDYNSTGAGFGINISHNDFGDQDLISQNSIYCNEGLGIDLNFSEAFSIGLAEGNDAKIQPVLNPLSRNDFFYGTAAAGDNIEIFYNGPDAAAGWPLPSCDCEGRQYLTTVVADGGGNWSADLGALGKAVQDSSGLTATATDAVNNTSQFANCCRASGGLLTAPTTVCDNEDLTIRLYNQVGSIIHLQQSFNAGPFGNIDSTAINVDSVTFTVTGLAPGDYVFRTLAVSYNQYSGVCDSISDGVNITITVAPNVAITEPAPKCEGSTGDTLETVTAGASTYAWNTGSTSDTIHVYASGSYTVTVYNANASCSATDDVVFTITSGPAADVGADTAICLGSTFSRSVLTNGDSYVWSTGESSASITRTPNVTTTYMVTVSLNGDCTQTDEFVVTVNPLPTATPPNDTLVCPGTSVTLTAGGGSSYLWNTGATLATITATVTTSTTYSITVDDGNGCLDSTAVAVNVHQATITDAGNPVSICGGDSTTLTALPAKALSYTWSTGGTAQSITVAPAGTSNFTVSVTDSNGCFGSDFTTVTINSLPTVTINGAVLCAGESFSITPTGGGSYVWDDGSTAAARTGTAAGTYTVTVTDGNACTASDTAVVIVNAVPVVNAGAPVSLCSALSASLNPTNNSTWTYVWSSTQGGALDNPNIRNPNVSFPDYASLTADTSVYFILDVTDLNGCAATDSVLITFEFVCVPYVYLSVNDSVLCLGDTTSIGAQVISINPVVSYDWSDGTLSGSGPVVISPTATTTYSITITDNTGGTDRDSLVVYVNPLPTAEAGENDSICPGAAASLTASGGLSYLWDNAGTEALRAVTVESVYTVTVTDSNGCTDSDTVNVFLLTTPTALAGNDTSICQNATAVLMAQGGISYVWDDGRTDATVNVTAAGTYTVTVTDDKGCTDTDAVTVTVNPLPIAEAGDDQTICEGDSASVSALGGILYLWNTGDTVATHFVSAQGSYTVTATDNNGCTGSDNVQITISPIPVANASSDKERCIGNSATLTGNSGMQSWLWNTGETTETIIATPVTTTTYTLTITNLAGCTDADSVVVTIHPLPVVTLTLPDTACSGDTPFALAGGNPSGGQYTGNGVSNNVFSPALALTGDNPVLYTYADTNQCENSVGQSIYVAEAPSVTLTPAAICAGDTAILTVSATAATAISYLWSDGNSSSTLAVQSGTTASYTVTVSAAGCSTIDSVSVTVSPIPTPAISTPEPGCAPRTVALYDETQPPADDLLWNFGDPSGMGNLSTHADSGHHTYAQAGLYDIILTATSNGCSKTDTFPQHVTVYEVPVATFTYTPPTPSTFSPTVDFRDLSTDSILQWGWHFGDPLSAENISTLQHPTHTYSDAGSYVVSLLVDNGFCTDETTRTIQVTSEHTIYVPNAFTPNDDLKNDRFRAYGVGIKTFTMQIYTRWGELVYETDELTGEWDGKKQGHDETLPIDVYVWLVRYTDREDKSYKITGRVTLAK